MAERSTAERVALVAMQARLTARAGSLDGDRIRRAFKELSMVMHPDRGGNRISFEMLVQARDALLKQATRTAKLRSTAAPATPAPPPQSPRRIANV